jgi:hypothetical protein
MCVCVCVCVFMTFGCRVYNGNQTGRRISDHLLLIGRMTKNTKPCEGGVVTVLLLVNNAVYLLTLHCSSRCRPCQQTLLSITLMSAIYLFKDAVSISGQSLCSLNR